jgi:hypothetical protein
MGNATHAHEDALSGIQNSFSTISFSGVDGAVIVENPDVLGGEEKIGPILLEERGAGRAPSWAPP